MFRISAHQRNIFLENICSPNCHHSLPTLFCCGDCHAEKLGKRQTFKDKYIFGLNGTKYFYFSLKKYFRLNLTKYFCLNLTNIFVSTHLFQVDHIVCWWGSCGSSRVEEYEEDEDTEDDGDAQGVESDRAPQVHPWQPESLFHRLKQRLCNCHGSIFSSALFNCQRTISSTNHLFLQPYTWFVPEPRTWHLSQLGVAFDQVAVGLSLAKYVVYSVHTRAITQIECYAVTHSHTHK